MNRLWYAAHHLRKAIRYLYVTHLRVIPKIPVVILFTAKIHIQNSYLLSTKDIYVFRTDLRTNNDYSIYSNGRFLS
jgi:hypothetical protein